MTSENKRLIVVLGMHRSGTSAVTRGLKVLGVELGEKLIPAMDDVNAKGFWEEVDINNFNSDILDTLGFEWNSLTSINASHVDYLRQQGFFLRAAELLKSKVGDSPIFGFKDPRVAKLLPFWKEVFVHCQFDVSYVLAIRHPLSIAHSLSKRDGFEREHSYLLWLGHTLTSLSHSAGTKRVLVDYDLLMKNPAHELERIAKLVGLEVNPASLQDYQNEFLDQNLRHTSFQLNDLLQDASCPDLVKEVYPELLFVAKSDNQFPEVEFEEKTARWSVGFSQMKVVSQLVDKLLQNKKANLQSIRDNEEELAKLANSLLFKDKQIAQLITDHEKVLMQKEEQGAQIITNYKNQLDEIVNQLDGILNSKSWKLTRPLRVIRRNVVAPAYRTLRRNLSHWARQGWQKLPLSTVAKQKIKAQVFRAFPFLLRSTVSYRAWANAPQKAAYVPLLQGVPLKSRPAKVICFYLPQFHAIPENDAWWGKGFTEWTNVNPAQPLFEGHYQPHQSGELGDYNLLDSAVQQRQIELAKLYGIEGFCFYFYWFGGQRLLEKPVENYLNDATLDLPFCLCWANENWSRRWDGLESEVLMRQQHSPEDDIAFIEHLSTYLRDPRYIRIDGKPLVIVYRPSLLPTAKETSERWRDWCRTNGVGEIYLAYTQSYEAENPCEYGFDAAIEFPPNNSAPPNITDQVKPLHDDFAGTIYDWRVFVERSEHYQRPDYPLYRSVCPSWDNTARRKNRATVFLNNSPSLYKRWLTNAINDTVQHNPNPDQRLVFVNAWNEWAEGAHLEPDVRDGYAYLQATRDALSDTSEYKPGSVLVVTHDCHPHGAQLLILETAKQWHASGFRVSILALSSGMLSADFEQLGEMVIADRVGTKVVTDFLNKVKAAGTTHAITSSVVSGSVVPKLKAMDFKVLSLIHELPGVIHGMKQAANARLIAATADKVVFPSELVYEKFKEIAPLNEDKVILRHQGLVRKNPYKLRKEEAHQLVCQKHHLDPNTQIVLNVAYMDHRKGIDLFVDMAVVVLKAKPNTTFIWVGHSDAHIEQTTRNKINQLGLESKIILAGFERDPMAYYAAASAYALTSREDPFPNVVLESIEVGVPVVAFADATGAGEFIALHGGQLAKALDVNDFAAQIQQCLDHPPTDIHCDVSLKRYALDLMHHLTGFCRVSVVVPNYNYQQYIEQRLESIYTQNYPVYEVIVLDDASTDDSVNAIQQYLNKSGCEANVQVNASNSGSVFHQWKKGVEACSGDLVWIAEADDLAEPEFLQKLAVMFEDSQLVLAYSQSTQMDSAGNIIANDYLDYALSASDSCLTDYYRDGDIEIANSLCIKNTIPNVSAVVFAAQALKKTLADIESDLLEYRVAGDWLVYLHVLTKGKIFHSKAALNHHRRHTNSATSSLQLQRHLHEVIELQKAAFELVDVAPDVMKKAQAYIDQLREHFNLPNQKEVHSEKYGTA